MKYTIIAVVSLVILIGGYLVINKTDPADNSSANGSSTTVSTNENTKKDNPPVDSQPTDSSTQLINFNGEKLAYNYHVYDSEDYAAALNAKRPIFLFFYANWCPTCAEQEPMIISIMNSFENNPELKNFVAFRVNYNDNETDAAEKDLGVEFGVFYQHTMFTLDKDGSITKRFIGQTGEDVLRNTISEAVI